MSKKSVSLLVLLLVWLVAAFLIDNDIILPGPVAVVTRIAQMVQDQQFYLGIGATFWRAHLAFLISLLLGVALAFFSFRYALVRDFLTPWIRFLQTIPQISFIILLLFWFDQEKSILLVVILMDFPIAYFNQLESLNSIEQDYLDIIRISHQPWWYNLKKAYLPLSLAGLIATLQSALPLSLKVTVMSEVLIHTSLGIGRALSSARANIDMIGVFAWTLVMVLLISLETGLITTLLEKKQRRY